MLELGGPPKETQFFVEQPVEPKESLMVFGGGLPEPFKKKIE